MTRESLKFLHLADLHLGQQFTGGRLKLPYEKAQKRTREQQDILTKAIELAKEVEAEIILIAGDLWEESGLSVETVEFVIDILGNAGIPVVISPGNHDYYAPSSHYCNEITKVMIGKIWPDNVIIIQGYDFTHIQPPGLEGVSVTGIAYHSNQPDKVRRFGSKLHTPEADIRICVVHGSRDNYLPSGKIMTMPFKDEELLAQPFDYTALGHYHGYSMIKDSMGMIRAAYPGSTCALSSDETGSHGCIIGTVHRGGIHPSEIALKPLDPRQVYRLKIDVSGLQHIRKVETKITHSLKKTGVSSRDMALVELTGTYPGGSMNFSEEFINGSCFHLAIDTASVRPEWSIENLDDQQTLTTEGIFKARLRQMIEDEMKKNNTAEVTRLQNVLFYGLDALHNRPITQR